MFEISSKMLYLENLDGKKINTQARPDPFPFPIPDALLLHQTLINVTTFKQPW